jgi:gliding motility-associated-like protein
LCKTITVKDDFIFYVPNSFTPNGDGINEDFGPIVKGASDDYQFAIYNRWGELVFERTDNSDKWNGEHLRTGVLCSQGVYVWKVALNDAVNNDQKEYIGNVTLLR